MPTLHFFALILTDGPAPVAPGVPDSEFKLVAVPKPPRPEHDAQLFGPHARQFEQALAEAKATYLFHGSREVRRDAGTFFGVAHGLLTRSVEGLRGFGLDVLKLWPFPLDHAFELAEDPLAEDLFSVGFSEHPGDRFRAETFGLAKLGQREIVFEFHGSDLLDEASLMCSRLADYVLGQGRRVAHGQTMSFGFDRLAFEAAEGPETGGCLRGWHSPLVQRALPESLFPGIGRLEVRTYAPMSDRESPDLTDTLRRSFEQRQVVESLELSGDPPHQGTGARACACAGGERGLRAVREDPANVRDSGWIFTCIEPPAGAHELVDEPLGAIAKKLPQVLRYLALPPGAAVEWKGQTVTIDAGAAGRDREDDDDSGN